MQITSTLRVIKQAIREQPGDRLPLAILADYLAERGYERGAAKLRSLDPIRVVCPDYQAVLTQLASQNGRRRVRILSKAKVRSTILEAARVGWSCAGGDTVANCYGWRAVRTVCVAGRRANGTVRCGVGVGNAQQGSSPITPVIPGVRLGRGSNATVLIGAWANSSR